ncbi:MAG: MFS transporter [Candidatus Eremiobacteraeota bacterium]|nr:MFS transporter [Candidatus Eremiobacteraeota bacterium]
MVGRDRRVDSLPRPGLVYGLGRARESGAGRHLVRDRIRGCGRNNAPSLPVESSVTFERKLLLAAGGGWLFDAMDLLIVGTVVAAAGAEWHLDPRAKGAIITANLLGMFVGAALSGFVADRFGRRAVFIWTLLAYTLLSGLSAFAWDATSLAVIRFFAGVGLGGELPVASTLVAEFAPTEHRGRTVVLLESFWAYGSVLAALIGYLVIPRFGWRLAFVVGMLPALYVFVLRRTIPESPRFLQVRESPSLGSLRTLFQPPFLRRTLMLWIMWIAMVVSYYGIFTWLPSLLVAKGFTKDEAFLLNLAIAIFQIPGYFSAAYFVERIGRKATLVSFLALCALGAFMFAGATLAATPNVAAIVGWGGVIAFFNLGAWGVCYTYTPELYPTEIRATGSGLAASAGRLVGAFAPALVGSMLAASSGNQYVVFIAFTVVLLLAGLVVAAFGEETQGRSLEAISPAT